jgi:hypothetical protein
MSRKAPGMRKSRSCRQHPKQAARSGHRARRERFRQGHHQTFRLAESFWMLNFRRKVISKVSQSVSFFAVPQRSPHRDEHVR